MGKYLHEITDPVEPGPRVYEPWPDGYEGPGLDLRGIDWLICGGESGPGHRPIDPEWVRELRDTANLEDTAFFFKQWGGPKPTSGGRELDGRTWDEFPQVGEGGEVNVGSLFSGIEGFGLGFERAGMRVAWQVEIDPYCRAVLAQHFPDAERFEDVCEVGAHNLAPVDILCGGFPCQDLSGAGKGAGLDGARSGLWSEFARIIGELRPRYVVVENVPALTRNEWLGRVLGDLAACGYDAEWDCLPASAFGAPHQRDRIWLVAYPGGEGRRQEARGAHGDEAGRRDDRPDLADAPRNAEAGPASATGTERQRARPGGQRSGAGDAANPACSRGEASGSKRASQAGADEGLGGSSGHWGTEPDMGRVADGVPSRVDRLSALGNALVPQIAEWIGRRILDFERAGLAT